MSKNPNTAGLAIVNGPAEDTTVADATGAVDATTQVVTGFGEVVNAVAVEEQTEKPKRSSRTNGKVTNTQLTDQVTNLLAQLEEGNRQRDKDHAEIMRLAGLVAKSKETPPAEKIDPTMIATTVTDTGTIDGTAVEKKPVSVSDMARKFGVEDEETLEQFDNAMAYLKDFAKKAESTLDQASMFMADPIVGGRLDSSRPCYTIDGNGKIVANKAASEDLWRNAENTSFGDMYQRALQEVHAIGSLRVAARSGDVASLIAAPTVLATGMALGGVIGALQMATPAASGWAIAGGAAIGGLAGTGIGITILIGAIPITYVVCEGAAHLAALSLAAVAKAKPWLVATYEAVKEFFSWLFNLAFGWMYGEDVKIEKKAPEAKVGQTEAPALAAA